MKRVIKRAVKRILKKTTVYAILYIVTCMLAFAIMVVVSAVASAISGTSVLEDLSNIPNSYAIFFIVCWVITMYNFKEGVDNIK